MQFRLRTLLIALALGPVFLAAGWCFVRDEGYRNAALELAPAAPLILGFVVAIAYVGASVAGAIIGKS
jgi:hypothetical protein